MTTDRLADIERWSTESTNGDGSYSILPIHFQELIAAVRHYRNACVKMNDEVCQTLAKALGYPRFCDPPINETFPDSTEANGYFIGEHVAETLADEAGAKIEKQRELLSRVDALFSARPVCQVIREDDIPDFWKLEREIKEALK